MDVPEKYVTILIETDKQLYLLAMKNTKKYDTSKYTQIECGFTLIEKPEQTQTLESH